MSWFDEDADRPLLAILHQAFRSPTFGAVSVDGREGSGQIYFADHEIVFVTCEGRIPLRSELELSGAADHDELAELMRTAGQRLADRGRINPAVVAVVRDHTEAAFAELQRVRAGRARVELGEAPPFGPLMSVSLPELTRAAALVDVRARASALRQVARETRPLPPAVHPPTAVEPATEVLETSATSDVSTAPSTPPAPVAASRSSALRRLIGAMRTPRTDTQHA